MGIVVGTYSIYQSGMWCQLRVVVINGYNSGFVACL